MGCNATFAIAANETNMNKVVKTVADHLLTERDAQKLLAKNLKDEAEAGNLKTSTSIHLNHHSTWRRLGLHT